MTTTDLYEAARQAVLPGFLTRIEVVEQVSELYELDVNDRRASEVVAAVWDARRAEETTWTGESDYDRLAAAFADLDSQGIVARMNFTCCNTCGTTEIDDERTPVEAPPGGYPFREWAYTFFHQQDAERLSEDRATLYLTYSAFRPALDADPQLLQQAQGGDEQARTQVTRQTDTLVGQQVAETLRRRGLDVRWSGDPEQRISVSMGSWRRPLPR
ncbi:DUF6891 domain-containing protein [Lapillicoccus sp.]|uniref:DUF6891 domain-containing protein n=1 Tax=Lapillicoccus sp. TaxID=1909287 RepID=UPI003265DFA8